MRPLFYLFGISFGLTALTLSAQDRPVPVHEAAAKMTAPDGFRVTLFAGEPEVVQPISFTFDDRGRMWVVECLSYPKWKTDGTGHDRIVIFEDTDNDGKHDKRTVFYDQGSNLSGIEYGFGGVWLTAVPNLIFIPDRNQDDVPDGPPEIVLDGWDLTARHNVVNSPAWGPDGWLYGCNGILSNSKIGAPGTPDAQRVVMNCGVWRYHPTRKVVESFAHGTTNPWGLDWDEYGQMLITNCVIKHVFHFVPGGHYDRMFGQDVNPYTYHLMPSIADHLHWAGGHWTTSRGGEGLHSDAGGGHAHAGCMVYLGDNFPKEYRNNVFTLNIHGARLNRDTLEQHGSSYVAKHAPDFLFANDPWFRGLVVKYGPDGGVYFSDWTDTGECHNYDVADTTNGRIYKVVYGRPGLQEAFNLTQNSDLELAALQGHENDWWVRHARRLLQERAVQRSVGEDPVKAMVSGLLFNADGGTPQRLRSLWGLHAVGALDLKTITNLLTASGDEHVVSWLVQLAVDDPTVDNAESAKVYETLAELAKTHLSPRVLMALASASQRLASTSHHLEGMAIVRNLVQRDLGHDPYLPLMVWYAIEAQVIKHPKKSVALLPQIHSPLVRESLARRMASLDGGLDKVLQQIAQADGGEWQADALAGIVLALGGAARLNAPPSWPAAAKKLAELNNPAARRNKQAVGLIFNDAGVRADLLKLTSDAQADAADRQFAIELLVTDRTETLPRVLISLLDDPQLRAVSIRGLAAFNEPQTPAALLQRYAKLSPEEKEDVVQTLSARPEWAGALLDAVKSGAVPKFDVSSLVVRQLLALKHDGIKEQVAGIWGEIKPASKLKKELAEKYRHQLTADFLAQANVSHGRALFTKTCGGCHKLYGQGGAIGPELTGAQRTNLDYLLDNILDPSAIVAREYKVTVLELASGRVVQGVVLEENDFGVTVQTPNEKVTVPKDEIETRTPSDVSMMPEGLFERLSPSELRDLVGYLKTTSPPEAAN
ncbi:MAG: PVC-type heme-binding CxxCH protein [Planctomycetaceae bacterium]